jgi:hypothetical protein
MKSLILNSARTAYSVLTGRLFKRPVRTGDDDLFSGLAARRADRAVHRAWPAVRDLRADGKVLMRDLRSAIASELRWLTSRP